MSYRRSGSLCCAFLLGSFALCGPVQGQVADEAPPTVAEAREQWAYRALQRPTVPEKDDHGWARSPIDRFILDALRDRGIAPNPAAPTAKLVRRASVTLLGLPPTPDDVARLDIDSATDQYLASPHYGERWARHWLDVVRFGESTGYEADSDRKHAYQYRDAVIRALNEDIPFDRFARWQLAGDELAPDNRMAIALTGFLAAGPSITNEGGDKVKYAKLDDVVSTVGSAFLGLTVGCARCHDHKYDPIPTRDYYELVGAFISCTEKDVPLTAEARALEVELRDRERTANKTLNQWRNARKDELLVKRVKQLDIPQEHKDVLCAVRDNKSKRQRKLRKQYEKQLRINDREMEKQLTDEQRAELKALKTALDQARKERRSIDKDMGRVMSEGNRRAPKNYLLDRGNWRHKTEIGYGFLKALMPNDEASATWIEEPPKDARTPWRRRAVARWITDTKRGGGSLLARVIVNRVWQHHFGVGLVATAGNFGERGATPTHPELLDWLACELIENRWSLKHIHKLIMTSATWRQSSVTDARRVEVDPDATLLWRRRPRRVEAEVWRDSVLRVAGTLNPKMHGPSIKPWIPTDAIQTGSTRKWPTNVKDGPETWRRSVYIYTKRSMIMPMLEALDLPDATISCSVRNVTTVAPAALLMLNNGFIRDQSRHLAERLMRDAGADLGAQIGRAYALALGRAPDDDERAEAIAFLSRQAKSYAGEREPDPGHRKKALINYCQVILALNEFLFVD